MTAHDLAAAKWHKSTRSASGEACVEVAENLPGVVLVRDTKHHGTGPVLSFTPTAWTGFLTDVKTGRYDLP